MHWNVIDYNKFLNIVFMHLNKQNFIIILAAFSLLSSCVYHFDLDEISEVPKLTVYSYPKWRYYGGTSFAQSSSL